MMTFANIKSKLYKKINKEYEILNDDLFVKCSKNIRIGNKTYSSAVTLKKIGVSGFLDIK